MGECIYFTRFKHDPWGDGGQRWAHQVANVFADYEPRIVSLAWETPISWWPDEFFERVLGDWNAHTWGLLRQQYHTGGDLLKWAPIRRRFVWLLSCAARHQAEQVRPPAEGHGLALIEDPIFFPSLVRALKKSGWQVVAVCHNLESLSSWQVTEKGQPILFRKELERISLCDLAITISKEERALLTQFGVPAVHHGYYPTPEVKERLLEIRRARRPSDSPSVLVLGSTGNHATLDGIKSVIQMWCENDELTQTAGQLRVAGFGTESLKDVYSIPDEKIVFLGSLSRERLDKEMTTAHACICHQNEGSGALTRIMDSVIAGLPVMANEHAARSYHNVPGVWSYTSLKSLLGAFAEIRKHVPAEDIPDAPDISEIHSLLEAGEDDRSARSDVSRVEGND